MRTSKTKYDMEAKRCHFNSWVVKLLPSSYTTITLFSNSFFRKNSEEYDESVINHEMIHQDQQLECFVLGLFLGLLICVAFSFTSSVAVLSALFISALAFYYVCYGIEYLLAKWLVGKYLSHDQIYHQISFEEEAYENENDLEYLDDRKAFAWFKYIKIVSYLKK